MHAPEKGVGISLFFQTAVYRLFAIVLVPAREQVPRTRGLARLGRRPCSGSFLLPGRPAISRLPRRSKLPKVFSQKSSPIVRRCYRLAGRDLLPARLCDCHSNTPGQRTLLSARLLPPLTNICAYPLPLA